MYCVWCENEGAAETTKDTTWIEPGGKEYVVVEQVPAIDCPTCGDVYVPDDVNEQVDEAMNTVDVDQLGNRFSYQTLMSAPRLSIFKLAEQGRATCRF